MRAQEGEQQRHQKAANLTCQATLLRPRVHVEWGTWRPPDHCESTDTSSVCNYRKTHTLLSCCFFLLSLIYTDLWVPFLYTYVQPSLSALVSHVFLAQAWIVLPDQQLEVLFVACSSASLFKPWWRKETKQGASRHRWSFTSVWCIRAQIP